MRRSLLSVAVVLMLVAAALAEDEIIDENPRYPGKCFDARRNATYAVDATWNRVKEPCTELACKRHTEPGKFIIKKTTCARVTPKAGCTIEEGNRRANYPACCKSLKCPNQG